MLSNCERQTYFHILPMALRSDENVVKNLPGGKDFIIAFRKTENCARKNRWGNWVTVCQLRTIINRNHDSWCLAFKKALLFCRHSPWFVKSKIKNKLEDESSVNTVKHLRRQAICSSWVNLGKTATTRKKHKEIYSGVIWVIWDHVFLAVHWLNPTENCCSLTNVMCNNCPTSTVPLNFYLSVN